MVFVMGRTMLARPTTLIREVKRRRSTLSRSLCGQELAPGEEQTEQGRERRGSVEDSSWWVPHPRTGIYYPRGHEWVMEDVPRGASRFRETYWLRSFEGVEKPASDHPTTADIFDHPHLHM